MSEYGKIEGKTFVITGAASGLGALYAEAFLKEGAKKIVILDVAEEIGRATTEKLNTNYHNRAVFVKCDVSDEDSITQAFHKVVDDFGTIDVIINNAGVMNDAPDKWRKATDVNWQGLVSLTMKGVEHMRKDKGGRGGTVVNVSSIVALLVQRYVPIYGGSKMAVLHFSQSLASEGFYERTGVRVLTICFSTTDTPLMANLTNKSYDKIVGEQFQEAVEKMKPLQKVESAVSACIDMFKEGSNGSVWVSAGNRPVKDITQTVQDAFKSMEETWNF